MKIVVLAGGLSLERDVSLASGSLVANALARKGHEVLLLDLYKGIEDTDFNKLFSKEQKKYNFKIEEIEPDLINCKRKELIGKNVLEVCKIADIVFIALHGSIGENGKLQAIFDVFGIKYTGTGYEGSLIAMNKILTKKLLEYDKIKTAKWTVWEENMDLKNIEFPVVVKPCSNGSSIGISIANNKEELKENLRNLRDFEDEIIIEQFIKGREFSVAILDGRALQPIEIIPKEGFYDYKNKYQIGMTKEICPPELEKQKIEEMQNLAKKIHTTLKLGGYSRIDFILSEQGDFYCLEANTLPGMTTLSLMPQEALAENISYEDLCEKILDI